MTPETPLPCLNQVMVLTAMDPVERFRQLLVAGCPARNALEEVCRTLPKESDPPGRSANPEMETHPWNLVRFLIRCLRDRLIAFPDAEDLLLGYRIHPWSLLWGDPTMSSDEILAWGPALNLPEGILSELRVGLPRYRNCGPAFEELPEGLKVASLCLRYRPRLTSIGSGFESEAGLQVTNCGLLTTLPEGIRTVFGLSIRECSSFSRLPLDFCCGGLQLFDLPLLKRLDLPPQFTGSLYVEDCGTLDSIRVESHQLESFDLVCCPVSSLPSDLTVDGRMEWTTLPVTAIPSGLQVAGHCRLSDLRLCTAFGEGIRIGGDLVLAGMPELRTIPEDLSVGGQVFLETNMNPSILPRHLRDHVVPQG